MVKPRVNPRPTPTGQVILEAEHIMKYYGEQNKNAKAGENQRVLVLDDIDLQIRDGEFIAILGPSGSGKSTLLRILAGLIQATGGDVRYHGEPLVGPNPNIAIVFQTFALFPWLTVLQNVELGLEARDLSRTQRTKRALAAIDTIGLDGFEDAYPKELSGGMRQRVGFARALVVEPELLFMDEPFSALDVLTAENLRTELMRLWREGRIPTKSIVLVTHNIEECAYMADKIVVMGHDPGRIRAILDGIPLDQRSTKSPQHEELIDLVYTIITQPDEDADDIIAARLHREAPPKASPKARTPAKPYQALPHIKIGTLNGLAERVMRHDGREDLSVLGRELQMEIDDLLPLVEAFEILGFGEATEGDLVLSPAGQQLAEGDELADKEIFREQVLQNVQLVRQVKQDLDRDPDHELPEDEVLERLEECFSEEEARRQLETAIDWARYAEIFAYDGESGLLYLEEPVLASGK
ncbi:MAG TPA: nitrate/sulfonate/bicarbonate ABC transporter ATP-binding protein [Ktedonobacterales bacterium]|nr:nitrate/sulfonate/bicarbonate ABC transporter ATP-binding protein [Ktedonobacterales bacterium]